MCENQFKDFPLYAFVAFAAVAVVAVLHAYLHSNKSNKKYACTFIWKYITTTASWRVEREERSLRVSSTGICRRQSAKMCAKNKNKERSWKEAQKDYTELLQNVIKYVCIHVATYRCAYIVRVNVCSSCKYVCRIKQQQQTQKNNHCCRWTENLIHLQF